MTEPTEVRDYFADQLRRAEVDFTQLTLVAPSHSAVRGRWAIAGFGAIVLVAVLVVRSLSPLSSTPGSSTVSPGSSSQSEASPATSVEPLGPDGIPLTLGSEPVLRGPAIGAYVASSTDSSSFLISGDVVDIEIDCASPLSLGGPTSPLLSSCGSGWNLVDGPGLAGLPLVLEPNIPGWTGRTPVVLRVHVHDPRAVECPASLRTACERAIVVEAVAWSGVLGSPAPSPAGIPLVVAQRKPLPSCGTETWKSPTGPLNPAARACFVDAYRAQQPAEFVSVALTSEGDPIATIYRVLGGGKVEIFIDSTQDRYGGSGRGWQQLECTSLANAATAPYDALAPGDNCVATVLN